MACVLSYSLLVVFRLEKVEIIEPRLVDPKVWECNFGQIVMISVLSDFCYFYVKWV